MRPLSDNDVEAEISYAYLHAVASHAKVGCDFANRISDGNGIDALLTSWGPFAEDSMFREVDLKVQLKATIAEPVIKDDYFSYFLKGKNHYDDLRAKNLTVHRILIVMYLPSNFNHCVAISENELLLKKCAYWVSLRGAGVTTNNSGETVYIPKKQIFNTTNLINIFSTLSRGEFLDYKKP